MCVFYSTLPLFRMKMHLPSHLSPLTSHLSIFSINDITYGMVHRTVEATESSSDKQGVLAFMSTKKTPNSVVVLSMSTPSTGPGSGAGSSASASCSEGQGPVEPLVEEGTAAAGAAEQGGTGTGYYLLSYIPIYSSLSSHSLLSFD